MSIFVYKARNKKGRVMEGLIDAVSEEAVASLLSEKKLTIIGIRKKEVGGLGLGKFGLLRRVRVKDLVFFFRQMSVMVEADLPIVRALRIMVKQTQNPYLRVVTASIADEVDGGVKFSEAMGAFPDVFSGFFINMIASGETSGRLSEVMRYLADQQEKDYELQSKIRGAMIYPAFIISGMILVGLVMMVFVVPQITGMLQESGVALPWATRALIFVSLVLKKGWWEIVLGILLLVAFLTYYGKTAKGSRFFDSLKIEAPIFGKIFRNIFVTRITRSFATLLRGGVPIAKALAVVKEVVGNVVYEDLLAQTIKEVEEGNSVSESFLATKYIPVTVAQMVNIGEETGKLEEVLEKVTNFYAREIDESVRNLTVLIEPMVMVLLGLAIGVFVAAVIMPMWQLSAAM